MSNDGGPAFPRLADSGMSLRDYFAAKALPQVMGDVFTMSASEISDVFRISGIASREELIAVRAYMIADAMVGNSGKGDGQ